ncbi:PASTA domain-containing protein [Herbiconiux sp. P15]|uniref:protein kinase domain-containing protein n=1 Tax=Herbiconiux liukaitaii TaxID=3342799 RepID=UPI0035B8234E
MADVGLISHRYRLVELLGTGGSASVFSALDTETGESVALKILHPHLSRSEAARTAFFREARAAGALKHPNIVGVLGVGVHETGADPQAWIALEHAPGTSLAEAVEQGGPLTVRESLVVADGVLAALEHAHAAGLVHRDVSPSNIMIERRPDAPLDPAGVRLLDFGLADAAGRAAVGRDLLRTADATDEKDSPDADAPDADAPDADADADAPDSEAPGTTDAPKAPEALGILGNAHYLSPEQARGDAVDARGDLYQLGAVLHFALLGTPPFVRDSARSTMIAHLQAPPPVVSVVRPGVPRAVDRMIVRALLKDPDARFRNAAEMQVAVRAALQHLDGSAPGRHAGSTPDLPATAIMPAPTPAPRRVVIATPRPSPALTPRTGGVPVAPRAAAASAATAAPTLEPAASRPAFVLGLVALLLAAVVVVAWALAASGTTSPLPLALSPSAAPTASDTPTPTPAAAAPSQAALVSADIPVPALADGTLAAARDSLAALGLVPGVVVTENSPRQLDTVLRTTPAAGTAVTAGTAVDLVVASGSNLVPRAIGGHQIEAVTTLRAAGFDTAITTREDDAAPGTVLASTPAEGATAPVGSTVTLVLAVPRTGSGDGDGTGGGDGGGPDPDPTATPIPTPEPTAPVPAPTTAPQAITPRSDRAP